MLELNVPKQTAMQKPASRLLHQRGFTLIEILVSVAILLILLVLSITSFTTLRRQVEIDSSGQNILSVLRLARSRTLGSEAESTYGVHFETDKYVFFKGNTYTAGASDNKEYTLTDSEIYEINLNGGGSEVVFNRIRGTTSQFGNVKIRLTNQTTKINTININSSGQVSLNATLSVSNTRVIDTRHLHFNLGWSIQNATTLKLVFTDSPNPTVTQNISMAGFFNAGKTVFDWSGTVNVNGSDQVLRVHTHALDAFNTTLSIHRDRRYNSKALTITIVDQGNVDKQIVSYTSSGTATTGSFGGTMTIQ